MEELSLRPFRDALLGRGHAVPALVVHEGAITVASEAARTLLAEAARPGARIADVVDAESRAKLAQALSSDRPGLWELNVLAADGSHRPMLLLVVPTRDETLLVGMIAPVGQATEMAGRLLEANGMLANALREQSRQAVMLRAARDRLEKLGALRDEFMATLSHDVRAPLTSIQLQASWSERSPECSSATARATAMIRRSVDRILELTNALLDTARIDAGTLRIEPIETTLRAVAEEAVEMLAPVAARARVRLEVSGPPAPLEGDAARLGQVAANLVDNAVRHSPAGGVVTLEIAEQGDHVLLAVRDRGPGVPAGQREEIFERFRQQGRRGSSGLGLYIVRQLVELHGGRIRVEDADPGARFVVELPRRSPVARPG